MEWLERYTFPSEARLGNDARAARRVYTAAVKQALRQGTTTAMYFATVHLVRATGTWRERGPTTRGLTFPSSFGGD
jgi:cytosine/adenosine deaminase-related metal-dependent hydrolase